MYINFYQVNRILENIVFAQLKVYKLNIMSKDMEMDLNLIMI